MTPPLHYRVEVADLNAHLYRVTLTIAEPAAEQRVSLPVWIPGSYLVREFSKSLQNLRARQRGKTVSAHQLDKCSWQIDCVPTLPLELSYEVYALDPSVRTAWLDTARGFFNGTSLCLRVEGQGDRPHGLELVASKEIAHWSIATSAKAQKTNKKGFGLYLASSYDELVDCPVEMGAFRSGTFTAHGVPHRFVVAGAPTSFDLERLLADAQKICEAEIRLWHGPAGGRTRARAPHEHYLFMLNAVDDGYGGLEHRTSTALICNRRDLPRLGEKKQPEGYTTLQGLISHEYFHTWNVKRLRPAEFARYDYTRENYTRLLWFFEGFTSYYDDLLLRRAGLIDDAGYLRLLNKTINQVQQTPGRQLQSVAQASFDAWVKYYRQDENTPNATVSYYTKGALVALCFDLTLRQEGKTTLDHVMRSLWQRCQAGPMTEADFAAVLHELGGRSFSREIAQWVHGTRDLPLQDLLERHGVAVLDEPAQLAQRLGLRVSESNGIQIKTVLRGGAGERAGLAAGDEWLGIEVGTGAAAGWRLGKLDELPLYAGSARKLTVIVARDKRLLRMPLVLPPAVTTWRLALRDAALAKPWLAPQD
ncbi:MAG TPA: peptidase M61 [Rhodoferax sp.]|nr:peptidase M61 [Rhodoferax sp.]